MILINDFKSEPLEMHEIMLKAVQRVLQSGWYILGTEVEDFEHKWADICGAQYAIGVANGMDAIEIGLRALDIGPGDEVVTTAMTAFATLLAIWRAGAMPVLADIDPKTGLLCIDSVSRCMSNKTKAVVLVHLYGQIKNMEEWVFFCKENKIHLIEDCAQAHMATWKGQVAGTFGSFGAYSFYPTKNLGAIGDGGAIITNNQKISEKATRLRNYGQDIRYHHPDIGLNSRLDEIQAAILNEKLKWLPEFTYRRQQIADQYQRNITNSLIQKLGAPNNKDSHVYHLFVVVCQEREKLRHHLEKMNVQSLMHYPIPLHQQPPCKKLKQDPQGLINSEKHAATCLSLPCHPQMSEEDVIHVVEAVNSFSNYV